MHAYHEVGYLPKVFAKQLEEEIAKTLRNTKEITVEEITLITNVFCSARCGSREFHKLLEGTILQRLDDLKKKMDLLY